MVMAFRLIYLVAILVGEQHFWWQVVEFAEDLPVPG
jgi:hypothetical protein